MSTSLGLTEIKEYDPITLSLNIRLRLFNSKLLADEFSFCFVLGMLHQVGTVSDTKELTCFQAMPCIF